MSGDFSELDKIKNALIGIGSPSVIVDGQRYKIQDDGARNAIATIYKKLLSLESGGISSGTTSGVSSDGDSAYTVAVKNGFTGSESEWLESLKGNKGDKGDAFEFEDFTEEQLAILKGKDFKYEDFTAEQKAILKGEDGASAYEIAVANGFIGTEAEWLKSLKGSNGEFLLSGTLAIGETTVAFTDTEIHETALISVYTDVFGVNPTNIATTEGSCVLTFEAQTVEIGVKVRFEYEEA